MLALLYTMYVCLLKHTGRHVTFASWLYLRLQVVRYHLFTSTDGLYYYCYYYYYYYCCCYYYYYSFILRLAATIVIEGQMFLSQRLCIVTPRTGVWWTDPLNIILHRLRCPFSVPLCILAHSPNYTQSRLSTELFSLTSV